MAKRTFCQLQAVTRPAPVVYLSQTEEERNRKKINALKFAENKRFITKDCDKLILESKANKLNLRFDGFFVTKNDQHFGEPYAVIPVMVLYHLDSDTLTLKEKRKEGFNNLIFHKRMIPKNTRGEHYKWSDLRLGTTYTLYDKNVRFVDCDKWTKEFYEIMNVELGKPESIPPDPYTLSRQAECHAWYRNSGGGIKNGFPKEEERNYLQFYCLRKDNSKLVLLLFYLPDNTMEIRESKVKNPRQNHEDYNILPFIDRQQIDKNCILPTTKSTKIKKKINCYKPDDLKIGVDVFAFGYQFLIYDCDEFTKDYFKSKYSKAVFNHEKSEKDLGILSKEDKPFTSVYKYFARLESHCSWGKCRRFVIKVFTEDNTVSVFELPCDGIKTGPFLSRRQIEKPTDERKNMFSHYLTHEDFGIGKIVQILGHKFLIISEEELQHDDTIK